MCGNRVEELESRVQELEASVDGLTDELIECKVRMRELEDAADVDLEYPGRATEESTPAEASEPGGEPEDGAEATKPEAPDEEDNTEDAGSDIIVA